MENKRTPPSSTPFDKITPTGSTLASTLQRLELRQFRIAHSHLLTVKQYNTLDFH